MSIQTEQGDMRRIYLRCDADGCPHTLKGKGSLALTGSPAPSTGWVTVDKDTEQRRDYCAEHADQASL